MNKNNKVDLPLNKINEEEKKMDREIENMLSSYFKEEIRLISEEEEKEMKEREEVEMLLSEYFQEEVKLENKKEETTMAKQDKLILNKIKEEREAMENIYRFIDEEVSVDELFELLGNLTHEQLMHLLVRCNEGFEHSLMFGDEETTPGYERIGDVFEIIEQIIDSKVCYLDSYYFDELLFDNEEELEMITIYGVEFEKGQLEEWVEGLTRKELDLLSEQEEVTELASIAVNETWKRIEEEMDAFFTKGHREYDEGNYEEWLVENFEFIDEVIELD